MENISSKSQVHENTLRVFFIIFITCFSINPSFSQSSKAEKEFAKAIDYLRNAKAEKALPILERTLKIDPDYPDALLAVAEIYYSKPQHRKEAYKYYQRLIDKHIDFDRNAHYRIAEYYKDNLELDKARYHAEYFLKMLKEPKDSLKIQQANRRLKQIDFMEDAIENPVAFEPKNMTGVINSEDDEYFPTLTADEQTFIFTRFINQDKTSLERKGDEDFYVSYKKDGEWSKALRMAPPFNSDLSEGALSISPDGRTIYFTRCNTDDGFGSCDIYYSERLGDKWSTPKNIGRGINSSYWESQPSIASDGRTLFFASNRKGGYGKSDIWYSYKDDNGKWGQAQNLGEIINTEGDESFPFIHPSNTTLYFCSDYHIGMGGMDIFYSRIKDGKFTEPINIGYPINTTKDETNFIVSPSATQAIYSSDMEGGYGGRDLYVFELYKQAQPRAIVYMKGKVIDKISNQPLRAKFEVKDLETNKVVASTFSDSKSGEYLVVLPIGAAYALNTQTNGYLFYSENFNLTDDNHTNSYKKDILLTPIIEGESVVLNNIFFESNSSELLLSSIPELTTLVNLLKDNPTIRIEISGHTDNTGNAKLNLELSNKRAQSVRDYLHNKGIAIDRISAKGYADSKPIATNDTEQGKAKNRRTEFKITAK